MSVDRREMLRRQVAELLSLEREIASALEHQQLGFRDHPDVVAAIELLRPEVEPQGDLLAAYLEDPDGELEAGSAAPSSFFDRGLVAPSASQTLRVDGVAFSYAASGYAALFELALRLYEPPLREIAPAHMATHLAAAQTVSCLLPAVVAEELANDGLECQCICPMCSIGICGCVAVAQQTLTEAVREAVDAQDRATDGFVLQPPRSGSQLEHAGIGKADRLLAVDGQPVASVLEIQAAIRRHEIGDELRLLVAPEGAPAREIVVRHVHDYP